MGGSPGGVSPSSPTSSPWNIGQERRMAMRTVCPDWRVVATATSQEKVGGVWWIDTTSIDIWWPLSSS